MVWVEAIRSIWPLTGDAGSWRVPLASVPAGPMISVPHFGCMVALKPVVSVSVYAQALSESANAACKLTFGAGGGGGLAGDEVADIELIVGAAGDKRQVVANPDVAVASCERAAGVLTEDDVGVAGDGVARLVADQRIVRASRKVVTGGSAEGGVVIGGALKTRERPAADGDVASARQRCVGDASHSDIADGGVVVAACDVHARPCTGSGVLARRDRRCGDALQTVERVWAKAGVVVADRTAPICIPTALHRAVADGGVVAAGGVVCERVEADGEVIAAGRDDAGAATIRGAAQRRVGVRAALLLAECVVADGSVGTGGFVPGRIAADG